MKHIVTIAAALLLAACGICKPKPATHTSDSTRIEVHTETVYVHDTAYFDMPVIVEHNVTLDTASHLANDYAFSDASVSGGILSHTLGTKPAKLPVIVQNKVVTRDSLVYRDREVVNTVEVEKKLTRWQTFKMQAGVLFMVVLAAAVAVFIIKLFAK